MAKNPDSAQQPEAQPTSPAAGEQQQRRQVEVNEEGALTSYSNFCRVTGTPEELLVDFGLNSQPFGTPTQPIQITQRIVVNFYTAKRLLHALHLAVQRHEQAFGALETDIQKRVIGGGGQQSTS